MPGFKALIADLLSADRMGEVTSKPHRYVRDYFDGYIHLTFTKATRLDFRAETGFLLKEWCEKYPFLYQECYDAAAVQARTGNHFGEWYLACALYERYGLFSLIEKYETPIKHPIKHDILRSILGSEASEYLAACSKEEIGCCGMRIGSTQAPDLLVYDPDNIKNHCFIEVKTVYTCSVDDVKKKQDNYFPHLKTRLNVPTYLALVTEAKE